MKRVVFCMVCVASGALGATIHVSTDSLTDGPGSAWSNAFHAIQNAVDAAVSNDVVLVTNGVYDVGGVVQPGYDVTNRVYINKPITVRSVNGPDVTIIEGKPGQDYAPMRCACLRDGMLTGFTLTEGYTQLGQYVYEGSGAGALLAGGGVVSNCVITGNTSKQKGGGVSLYNGGLVIDCIIFENSALEGNGGGAYMRSTGSAHGTLERCQIVDNEARSHGGVTCDNGGAVRNCLVARNSATSIVGGISSYGGDEIVNCTIVFNTSVEQGYYTNEAAGLDIYEAVPVYNCISYYNTCNGRRFNTWSGRNCPIDYICTIPDRNNLGATDKIYGHCITDEPEFVNRGGGDYRLELSSPCINAGNSARAAMPLDLDHASRTNGTVDLGTYEYWPMVVTITNGNESVYREVTEYVVSGTNSGAGVHIMWWTNSVTGDMEVFQPESPWAVTVPLDMGANPITVYGRDRQGTVTNDSTTVTRLTEHGGDSPIHYAWTNSPSPAWPYTNWTTAARTIQAAVDAATTNDTVLATNGVYDAGGVTVAGLTLTNRVLVSRAMTVCSVNGPASTRIVGNGPEGNSAVRCAHLAPGTVLDSFTLTEGHGIRIGGAADKQGAGAFLDGGGTVTNCIVTGCESYYAAGVYFSGGGLVVDSIIESNSARNAGGLHFDHGGLARWCRIANNEATQYDGGGVIFNGGGRLEQCEVIGNTAEEGGGGVWTIGGSLVNCLVADNTCGWRGGGVFGQDMSAVVGCTIAGNEAEEAGGFWASRITKVHNCIIYSNTAPTNANVRNSSSSFDYTCTLPALGSNCTTNDPQFIGGGDYRLSAASPSIGAGNDAYATMALDLDGYARIAGDHVDLGAYERTSPVVDVTNDDASVAFETTTCTIGGRKNLYVVGVMGWTNTLTGANDTFPAVDPWTVANIALDPGANAITVWGSNSVGTVVSDTVTITRTMEHGESPSPVHYVSTNGTAVWPYTNWATAARAPQDAIEAAMAGDSVLVSNGVYDTGGVVLHGQDFTNRVVIEKDILVTSVNGSGDTFIVGASDNGGVGSAAARCVWMSDGLLSGFTITNGHTQTTGDWGAYQRGGGVFLSRGGVVSNCVISGCSASVTGGGVDFHYGGTVVECVIENNSASPNSNHGGGGVHLHDGALLERCIVRNNSAAGTGADGGGLYFWSGGHARNCLIEGNAARNGGGGVYVRSGGGLLENCTITGNSGQHGGGIYLHGGINRNCIIWGNMTTGAVSTNWSVGSGSPAFEYCCTAPTNALSAYGGVGCIGDDPQFMGGGDYRLSAASPSINAGNNGLVSGDLDLDGSPRILGSAVDMGAYEHVAVPVVDIATAAGTVFDPVSSQSVEGTAEGDIVGTMWWSNALSGASGTFAMASPWSVEVPLVHGRNAITVFGTNVFGTVSSDIGSFLLVDTNSPAHYVWTGSPAPAWPYTNWTTAAHVIQDAVDAASSNDTVWVTNGVYDAGGAVMPGYSLSNRVCVTRAVTVRSVTGQADTFIEGASHNGTNGPGAARCVYLTTGATLAGFTLRNGHTHVEGAWENRRGGGVYLNGGGTVSNCTVSGCSANATGGGVDFHYGGTVVDCVIENNSASLTRSDGGGGVHLHDGALLDRCIIRNNSAMGTGADGGGLYFWSGGHARNCLIDGNRTHNGGGGVYVRGGAGGALLENCTVIGNAGGFGGGVFLRGGTNRNCIVYDNTATGGSSSNWSVGSGSPEFEYCCIAPTNGLAAYGGAGCIDADPKLRWDYSPQDGSPCLDAGSSGLVTGELDLRGSPRIMGPRVDIGAYEWIYHTPVAGFGGALAFDGADDYVNVAYHSGLNPTNAFTVELWAYVTGGAGSYRSPVTSRNSNRGYILYAGSDDNWQFWIGSGIGYYKLRSGVPVELETWTHLAAVHDDGGTMTLYINGEVAGSPLTGVTFAANDAAPLYLGAGKTDGTSPDFYFPGQLDDVRIWRAALSANTITNWMYREVDTSHPAYTNRAGCYNLNDGGGMVATDAAYGHDGVLSGMDETAWIDSTAGNEWEWRSLPNTTHYGKLVGSDLNGSGSDGTNWTLTFEIVTPPTNGTAVITTDNGFSYSTPRLFAEDRFTYRVRDDYGLVSNVATSQIIVLPPVPYVDITNKNASVARTVTQITIGGTHSASAIGTLAWANAAAESSGELPVSGSDFLVADVPLVIGANKIAVVVTNAIGEEARDSVTIKRVSWHGGDSPTHYVSAGGADLFPYTNWATAAHAIQDAVDAAAAGDTVRVTNGVYDTGGAVTPGYSLQNRVCITRAVSVRSVNGWEHTTIHGKGPIGNNAVRCAYMSGDAVLSGFTLANGRSRRSGDLIHTRSGGGVLMDDGGLVERCRIRDNRAESDGAGVYIYYEGLIRDTLIHDNEGFSGSGVYMVGDHGKGPQLYNCTVVDNASEFDGGGIVFSSGEIRNCVVYFNTATTHPDTANHDSRGQDISWRHSCTLPRPSGTGNITNNPRFVSGSGYRLLPASPCIDAGNNAYMPAGPDFDGNARPLDGDFDGTNTVDIGAYEYDPVTTDSDGDQASDYEEHVADTDPTDSNDTFRITDITVASPPLISFGSSSNRWYSLFGRPSLMMGDWALVSEKAGAGGDDALSDTNEPPQGPFYRLGVELP
jgi:hypothetical protein